MTYRYLDDIAPADIAFEAQGKTKEELFTACAEAAMNVMVEDLGTIAPQQRKRIALKEETLEMLLLNFLQEFIYYKDAQNLLLRASKVQIRRQDNHFALQAEACGEPLRSEKHRPIIDVKAVTMHQLKVEETPKGWKARVVLDV